jgi:hypothetical protein
LQVDLSTAPTELVTQVATDRPRYRPGDVVRYRSVTLSRVGLKAEQDLAVEYYVTDPAGMELSGSRLAGETTHGVGTGELQLAATATGGRYTVVARSPDGLFPESRRDIHVHDAAPRQFDIAVEWRDALFAAGKLAAGSMTVKTPDGEPAAGVPLKLRAYVDGRQVELPAAEVATDGNGKAAVEIQLPGQIASRFGELGIQAGEQDAYWKDIPLRADQVQVDFYPEGGELTAQVENRVYFHGHDGGGEPLAIRGKVVNADNEEVCDVAAEHDGRGAFRFTPEAGQAYTLRIDDPPTILTQPALPAASAESRLVLDCGAGVFREDESVQVELRSLNPPAEFLIVAYCRGVLAGQVAGTAANFSNAECTFSVPVVAEAGGVLRITVLDYTRSPPEPLAERLVFRRPARQLRMKWTGLQPEYQTGETVRGMVLTTDEADRPVSAVLGVSAIDAAVLDFSRRSEPRMTTQFLILGDITKPEQLEDANFYLSDDPAAPRALDLLLATQGWRRFERVPASQMAGLAGATRDGLAYRTAGGFGGAIEGKEMLGAQPNALGMFDDFVADAPSRFDNRDDLGRTASAPLAPVTLGRTVLRTVDEPSSQFPMLIAGVVLLLLVVASAAVRWRPTWVAVATSAATAVGLVLIGVFVLWMRSGPPVAGAVATPEYSVPSSAPARNVKWRASTAEGAMEELAAEGMSRSEPAGVTAASAPDAAVEPAPVELPPASPEPAAGPPKASPVPGPADEPIAEDPAPKRAIAAAPNAAVPMAGAAGVAPPMIELRAKQLESAQLQGEAEKPALRSVQPPAQQEDRTERMRESGRPGSAPEVKPLDTIEDKKTLGDQRRSAQRSSPIGENKTLEKSVAPAPASAPADPASDDARKRSVRRFAYFSSDKRGGVAGDFPETVYWNPLLVTDEMGQATVEFDVPDTVTRFRILAEGHVDGRLGDSEQILTTRK